MINEGRKKRGRKEEERKGVGGFLKMNELDEEASSFSNLCLHELLQSSKVVKNVVR